jgi:hypothetical protein
MGVIGRQLAPAASILRIRWIGDAEQSSRECRPEPGCLFQVKQYLVHRASMCAMNIARSVSCRETAKHRDCVTPLLRRQRLAVVQVLDSIAIRALQSHVTVPRSEPRVSVDKRPNPLIHRRFLSENRSILQHALSRCVIAKSLIPNDPFDDQEAVYTTTAPLAPSSPTRSN